MTKEGLLISIGVLTAISPFVGLPSTWLAYILPSLGLIAAVVALLMLRSRRAARRATEYHEASHATS